MVGLLHLNFFLEYFIILLFIFLLFKVKFVTFVFFFQNILGYSTSQCVETLTECGSNEIT